MAKVVAAARLDDRSQAVLRKIEARGGVGLFINTDVTHRAEVAALVVGTLAAFVNGASCRWTAAILQESIECRSEKRDDAEEHRAWQSRSAKRPSRINVKYS